MTPIIADKEFILHSNLIYNSFTKLLTKDLLEGRNNISADEIAVNLYHAPFPVISHNSNIDPIFNYANKAAQDLWKMDWDTFTNLPSRFSAEPMDREERQHFLKLTARQGFVEGFTGIRITSDKKRFFVKDFILWNLLDSNDKYCGQAACFHQWEFL